MKVRRSRRRTVRRSRHAGAGRATALAPAGLVPAAGVLTAVLLGGVALVAKVVSPPGSLTHVARLTWEFLDFFVGVFTLLSLTATVVVGLLATDRIVLTPRLRVSAQLAHRATAVAALGFLLIHIVVKVAEGHASPTATVVPFAGGGTFAVGLGVIAAYLMVLAAVTGLVRGRFATGGRPWMWRALHATAYGCWAFALAHGLSAGRPAKTWVLWGYGVCAAAVALVLAMRALHALGARRGAGRTHPSLLAYEPARADEELAAELSALSTVQATAAKSATATKTATAPTPATTPAYARAEPTNPAPAAPSSRRHGTSQPAGHGRTFAPAAATTVTTVTATAVIPGPTTVPGLRTTGAPGPRPARPTPVQGRPGQAHRQAPVAPAPGGVHNAPSTWDTGAHAFPTWDTTMGGIPAYGTGPQTMSAWDTPVRGVPVYDAAANGMTAYGTVLPGAYGHSALTDTPPAGTPQYGTATAGTPASPLYGGPAYGGQAPSGPAYGGPAHPPAQQYAAAGPGQAAGVPQQPTQHAGTPPYVMPLHETPAHGIPVQSGGAPGPYAPDTGAPIGPLQWLHHGTTW